MAVKKNVNPARVRFFFGAWVAGFGKVFIFATANLTWWM